MTDAPASEVERLDQLLKPYRDASNANLQTMWEEFLAAHPAAKFPSSKTMSRNARLFLVGKRYRYALAVAGFRLLTGQSPPPALERAACWLEWYHLYTLFLDDIMDEDERRRTLPSAWSSNAALYRRADAGRPAVVFHTRRLRYGASQAILDALRIRSLAERAIESAKPLEPAVRVSLVAELTEVDLVLSDGQGLDIDFEGLREIPEEDYIRMSEAKTARLYMGAAATAAIAAGAPPEVRETLQEYALLFAVAFQDRDDLLGAGVVQSEIGGSSEGDIRQGKRTRLYILATEVLKGRERAEFLRAYGRGSRTTRRDVETVRRLLARDVLPLVEARIEKNLDLARNALDRIPAKDSEARALLDALLDAQRSRVR